MAGPAIAGHGIRATDYAGFGECPAPRCWGAHRDGTDFTLYAANLGEDPAALGVALETLQATAPDVIWLSEVPATRPAALEEAFDIMAAAYPYGMAWAPAPGRELRFLSRYPLRAREEFNPERARGRPGMRLVLDVEGQLLTVYALHTHPLLRPGA